MKTELGRRWPVARCGLLCLIEQEFKEQRALGTETALNASGTSPRANPSATGPTYKAPFKPPTVSSSRTPSSSAGTGPSGRGTGAA